MKRRKPRRPVIPPAGIPWLPPTPPPSLETQEAAIAAELRHWEVRQ